MLKPHTAVRHDGHGFARGFGVTMGNGHRRFFMQTGDQLGRLVATIVHDRFMQTSKTGARVSSNIFQVQTLDHIDHEVGAWTRNEASTFHRFGIDFTELSRGSIDSGGSRLGLLNHGDTRSRCCGNAFEKITTARNRF